MFANDIRDRPSCVPAPNDGGHRAMLNRRLSDRGRAAYPRPLEAWPKAHAQNALIRKLGNFIQLSPGELRCLADLQSKTEQITARTDLADEGQVSRRGYILQSGWAYCYKLLPDGGRQIITFSVPGDFLGMSGILHRASDHSFATITDSVVSSIEMKGVLGVFNEYPRLAHAFLWAIARDQAISAEHLVGIGRRSAVERTAHFFLELRDRLWLAGTSSEASFECPLNQYLLSDALGITPIHLNRVLRQLRERGLMTLREHRVVIDDVEGLIELAGYDNAYLDQPRPRLEAAS